MGARCLFAVLLVVFALVIAFMLPGSVAGLAIDQQLTELAFDVAAPDVDVGSAATNNVSTFAVAPQDETGTALCDDPYTTYDTADATTLLNRVTDAEFEVRPATIGAGQMQIAYIVRAATTDAIRRQGDAVLYAPELVRSDVFGHTPEPMTLRPIVIYETNAPAGTFFGRTTSVAATTIQEESTIVPTARSGIPEADVIHSYLMTWGADGDVLRA